MKRLLVIVTMIATGFLAGAEIAEAKRLGGGKSFGAQRQATTPAVPPAASGAQSVAPRAASGAPAAAGSSRWMGPLAGLAAGLGLAALLSHLGLSEGFASFLLLALIIVAIVFVVRLFLARRGPARSPLQYAGTGPGLGSTPGGYETTPAPSAARGDHFEPVMSRRAETAAAVPSAGRFPPGFDPAPFVEQAKLQFHKLQAAYDGGDRNALAEVMTPEMFAEIGRDIDGRGAHTATEILRLDADLLTVTTEGRQHWASVHFKGTLREDGVVLPKDFEEIWNLSKPVDGTSGWLLAGIEQVASA